MEKPIQPLQSRRYTFICQNPNESLPGLQSLEWLSWVDAAQLYRQEGVSMNLFVRRPSPVTQSSASRGGTMMLPPNLDMKSHLEWWESGNYNKGHSIPTPSSTRDTNCRHFCDTNISQVQARDQILSSPPFEVKLLKTWKADCWPEPILQEFLTSFTMDFISLLASCKSSGFLLFSSLARSWKTEDDTQETNKDPWVKGKESLWTIQGKRDTAQYYKAYTASIVTGTPAGVI